jgi:hypothetical protein
VAGLQQRGLGRQFPQLRIDPSACGDAAHADAARENGLQF